MQVSFQGFHHNDLLNSLLHLDVVIGSHVYKLWHLLRLHCVLNLGHILLSQPIHSRNRQDIDSSTSIKSHSVEQAMWMVLLLRL